MPRQCKLTEILKWLSAQHNAVVIIFPRITINRSPSHTKTYCSGYVLHTSLCSTHGKEKQQPYCINSALQSMCRENGNSHTPIKEGIWQNAVADSEWIHCSWLPGITELPGWLTSCIHRSFTETQCPTRQLKMKPLNLLAKILVLT